MISKFKLAAVVAITLLASPFTAIAAGDHDGGHDAGGGMGQHMARMDENRDTLKARLGAEYDAAVRAAKPGETEKGKRIFETNCVTCHGVSGKGDGPGGVGLKPAPANFTDPMHAYFYSDAGRLEIIRAGSPGSAMPTWKGVLNDEQIMEVFQYVRSLRPAKVMAANASDHAGSEMVMDHGAKENLTVTDQGVRAVLSFGLEKPTPRSMTKMDLVFTRAEGNEAVGVKDVSMKWSMPDMGHDLDTKSAEPHGGPGIFQTSYSFPMEGRYQADVSGNADGKALAHSFVVLITKGDDVKDAGHVKGGHEH